MRTRYLLRGGHWVATNDRGGDVQAGSGGIAVLGTAGDPGEGGPLRLEPKAGAPIALAGGVEEMAVRP